MKSKPIKNDEEYMDIALKEAKKAFLKNEVPIGAIIVNSRGEIIARKHNQVISKNDTTAHAEILAIKTASKKTKNYRLINTTMYVTIEPCIMCMGAIIHARIKKVVFGAFDKKWGACSSLYDFSKDSRLNHKVEVVSGVLKNETKTIIQDFFKQKRILI